jgi:hypothetical protein
VFPGFGLLSVIKEYFLKNILYMHNLLEILTRTFSVAMFLHIPEALHPQSALHGRFSLVQEQLLFCQRKKKLLSKSKIIITTKNGF